MDIFNEYGLIEVVVGCMIYWYDIKCDRWEFVLIGFFVVNMSIYVLDVSMNLVLVGVLGEMYIGGVGVVRGYWNCLDLIVEKFVYNLFVLGMIMYKMGDLVKWLCDGNFIYLGWIDE